MKRITFKKNPARCGRMRFQPSFAVKANGVAVATIAAVSDLADLWYAYGVGGNTYHSPLPLDKAKERIRRVIQEGAT